MSWIPRRRSQKLADEGFNLLDEGDHEGALDIAEVLEQRRFTAAFDIAAQSYAAMGDLASAIKTLERGVRIAPDCWSNWQLLGNYLSDLDRFDEAAVAYQHALACPDVFTDSVRLNQAVLANRRIRFDVALQLLDAISEPALAIPVACTRTDALDGLGKKDAAVSLAEAYLAGGWDPDEDGPWLGHLAHIVARRRLVTGSPANQVRGFVIESLEKYGPHPDLFELIRDMDARRSPHARFFRVMAHRELSPGHPRPGKAIGYFVTYEVVADSIDQAIELALAFEIAHAGGKLEVEEFEALDPRPGDLIGVYSRTGRMYYDKYK